MKGSKLFILMKAALLTICLEHMVIRLRDGVAMASMIGVPKTRTNAIGALMGSTLVAIGLLTGSVDTSVFTCWVENILLPNIPPNCVIVMDNATFHKGVDMQQLIGNSCHTLLYLPPYSPDLNPIEKKWAQAKQIRRNTNCTLDELFTNYLS
ncbi:transposase [Candidatus Lariskella endosymbiont of Epinotia ramella]|uniref:transposase n=1 Tax=Candidatus Lariskella endosymbiont of Epinotia ramella TaxID=3066224 RepID=UPI0030CDC288